MTAGQHSVGQASLENLIETEILSLECLHPGGLELTQEFAVLCRIERATSVLDLACGTGESACFLSQRFGAQIVGVDHSDQMIRACLLEQSPGLLHGRGTKAVGSHLRNCRVGARHPEMPMLGSAIFYSGLVIAAAGLALVVKPSARVAIPTRKRASSVAFAGGLLAAAGLTLPVSESRVTVAGTRLDEFAPVWQFHEIHTLPVAAPPSRVFEAIKKVRADEILLFRTLTWIRRGGQPLPQSILNAGTDKSLIDLATQTSFVRLAEESPRELVIGTVVLAPPGARGELTPQVFLKDLPPGFALATMNFLVTEAGPGRSLLSTETRVFANSGRARRRFAAYWRVIYPGSATIRRMWLRAIERRATGPETH